jgi:hypothetical protein
MAVNILERATSFNRLILLLTNSDLGEYPEGHHIATADYKLIVNWSSRLIRCTGRYQGMPGGP